MAEANAAYSQQIAQSCRTSLSTCLETDYRDYPKSVNVCCIQQDFVKKTNAGCFDRMLFLYQWHFFLCLEISPARGFLQTRKQIKRLLVFPQKVG